mmetsp:Transcript_27608/g.67151  ORF Transcript_27608/g.67151 Transcript_27608/m.67151 type:complete len:106 (-) Transcript_27608:18-335(-)
MEPVAAVDVSIYVCKALALTETMNALFMVPPIPVLSVASDVMHIVSKLRENGFEVLLVFDGDQYPPKANTNLKRYRNRPQEVEKLLKLYKTISRSSPPALSTDVI